MSKLALPSGRRASLALKSTSVAHSPFTAIPRSTSTPVHSAAIKGKEGGPKPGTALKRSGTVSGGMKNPTAPLGRTSVAKAPAKGAPPSSAKKAAGAQLKVAVGKPVAGKENKVPGASAAVVAKEKAAEAPRVGTVAKAQPVNDFNKKTAVPPSSVTARTVAKENLLCSPDSNYGRALDRSSVSRNQKTAARKAAMVKPVELVGRIHALYPTASSPIKRPGRVLKPILGRVEQNVAGGEKLNKGASVRKTAEEVKVTSSTAGMLEAHTVSSPAKEGIEADAKSPDVEMLATATVVASAEPVAVVAVPKVIETPVTAAYDALVAVPDDVDEDEAFFGRAFRTPLARDYDDDDEEDEEPEDDIVIYTEEDAKRMERLLRGHDDVPIQERLSIIRTGEVLVKDVGAVRDVASATITGTVHEPIVAEGPFEWAEDAPETHGVHHVLDVPDVLDASDVLDAPHSQSSHDSPNAHAVPDARDSHDSYSAHDTESTLPSSSSTPAIQEPIALDVTGEEDAFPESQSDITSVWPSNGAIDEPKVQEENGPEDAMVGEPEQGVIDDAAWAPDYPPEPSPCAFDDTTTSNVGSSTLSVIAEEEEDCSPDVVDSASAPDIERNDVWWGKVFISYLFPDKAKSPYEVEMVIKAEDIVIDPMATSGKIDAKRKTGYVQVWQVFDAPADDIPAQRPSQAILHASFTDPHEDDYKASPVSWDRSYGLQPTPSDTTVNSIDPPSCGLKFAGLRRFFALGVASR